MRINRRIFMGSAASLITSPTLARSPSPSVVVIGAGIIGASIGYHLARYGADVTILDRSGPALGTTSNSFAWLNAFGKLPYSYYSLNCMGVMGWRRLQQEIGHDLRIQWGGGTSWRELEQDMPAVVDTVRRLESWGYPIRLISRSQLTTLLPGIRVGAISTAWHSDIDGTLDPVDVTNTIVRAAIKLGAKLKVGTEVTALDTTAGKVTGVQTRVGHISADHVVLCMGNDTPPLAATAGLMTPLKESKGVLAHSTPMPEFLHAVVMPPDSDIKQNLDGRIVTGSDFGDSGALEANPETGARFLSRVQKYFPNIPAPQLAFMTLGHRVLPIDGHPIIGCSPAHPNVYVAVMHSGMTQAPIIGQLAAIEILDNTRTSWLADYRPERFS